jgi:hypothetical protein
MLHAHMIFLFSTTIEENKCMLKVLGCCMIKVWDCCMLELGTPSCWSSGRPWPSTRSLPSWRYPNQFVHWLPQIFRSFHLTMTPLNNYFNKGREVSKTLAIHLCSSCCRLTCWCVGRFNLCCSSIMMTNHVCVCELTEWCPLIAHLLARA